MKKQMLFCSLTGLVVSLATADVNLTINIKESDFQPAATTRVAQTNIVTPAFQNPIHNEDLATGDTTPLYTIKNSGRFYLAGDITAKRTSTATGVVFSINADNVTFNLNSKVIAPHVSSAHTGATAIQVTAGVSNTTVMNGTIQAVDSNGTARFAKGIEVPTTGTVNNTVKLHNLYVTRLRDVSGASRGFDLNGINDLAIENCTSNDATISTNGTAKIVYGAYLNTVNNLLIRNCEFNNNSATAASAASTVNGLYCVTCNEGIIDNVIASSNTATTTTSGAPACYGIQLDTCRDISLTNTQANSNISNGAAIGTVAGIYLTSSPLCTLIDCIANNNQDASTESDPIGFWISTGSDSCKLIRCRAEQNTAAASSSSAYGFFINSNCNRLENCKSNANSGTNPTSGMWISSQESQFINCVSNYNTSSGSGAYGFYLSGGQNNTFTSCEACSNTSTGSTAAAGFYSSSGTGMIFDGCTASGNDTSATGSSTAAGFNLAGTTTRTEILNCKAIGNIAGNSSSLAYGVYIASGTNCVVKNCYLAYNTVSAGAAFGFADDTSTGSTLLVNNIAVGQGKCLGDTLDASLQWSANVKPTSSNLNYFFKTPGTGDDPRNMIQEAPILNFLSISTTVGDWTNISLY